MSSRKRKRNLSSKVWDQWRGFVVNRDEPKKPMYTASDLAPLNIELVSDNDTRDNFRFEPFDATLTLMKGASPRKLRTLDLEADANLGVRELESQHKDYCYGLWYAIEKREQSYSVPTQPAVPLSVMRPWSKIDGECEFYEVDRVRVPNIQRPWAWRVLSLDEFCDQNGDYHQETTIYEHLQMAMFSFNLPDEDSILASELSALVQLISIRSRQPTFSRSPYIAVLLISFFGPRQVRVIQALYHKGTLKEGGPKLTVTLEKAMNLAGDDGNENEKRMGEILRWMACKPIFPANKTDLGPCK